MDECCVAAGLGAAPMLTLSLIWVCVAVSAAFQEVPQFQGLSAAERVRSCHPHQALAL